MQRKLCVCTTGGGRSLHSGEDYIILPLMDKSDTARPEKDA